MHPCFCLFGEAERFFIVAARLFFRLEKNPTQNQTKRKLQAFLDIDHAVFSFHRPFKLTLLYLAFLSNLYLCCFFRCPPPFLLRFILFFGVFSPFFVFHQGDVAQRTRRLRGLSLIYSQLPGSNTGPHSMQPYICPIISPTLQLKLSGLLKMFNRPICVEDGAASGSIDLLLSVKY